MANAYKILGQSSPAATTNTDLITVGALKSQVISTIIVANTNSTFVTVRIYARIAGAAAATSNAIVYDSIIAGNSSINMTLGITLAATDVVTVYASATNVVFTAFGSEIS